MTIRYDATERRIINEAWDRLQRTVKEHLNEPDPLPVIEAAWQRQWGFDKVNTRAQLLAAAVTYYDMRALAGGLLWSIGQPRRDMVALVNHLEARMGSEAFDPLRAAMNKARIVRQGVLKRHTDGEEIDS